MLDLEAPNHTMRFYRQNIGDGLPCLFYENQRNKFSVSPQQNDVLSKFSAQALASAQKVQHRIVKLAVISVDPRLLDKVKHDIKSSCFASMKVIALDCVHTLV